jgi:hypothetical protein
VSYRTHSSSKYVVVRARALLFKNGANCCINPNRYVPNVEETTTLLACVAQALLLTDLGFGDKVLSIDRLETRFRQIQEFIKK